MKPEYTVSQGKELLFSAEESDLLVFKSQGCLWVYPATAEYVPGVFSVR
jgi:hypothetical protein